MRSSRVFVIGGICLALGLIIISFFIQNRQLKDEIFRLESDNHTLLLASAQQDPAYALFMNRFPEAACRAESGVVTWSNLAERDGKKFLYILEFKPNTGARLLQAEVLMSKQTIHAEKKELSLKEFSALTEEREPKAPERGE
jgi:hypothetical protein